jgi:hypothetical protein
MTLGRTPTGAIKIKTDSPGLRAVECACCGGVCEEDCGVKIPQPIRNLIESASETSWTLYGLSPTTFNQFSPTEWNSVFRGENYQYDVGFFGGCLFFSLTNDTDENGFIAQSGKEEYSCGAGFNSVYGEKFTINSITNFDYAYVAENPSLFPTPIFVFT